LKLVFTLILTTLMAACSLFGRSSDSTNKIANEIQKNLGPRNTDYGLAVTLQFHCGPQEGEPFKLRAFKYKMRVLENNKEFTVGGTQTRWLDTNLTELKLKYAKGRKITFKNVEISTDKWIRSFPESQLKDPIAFSLQECKDLGSY
jgi:hypothetical protein